MAVLTEALRAAVQTDVSVLPRPLKIVIYQLFYPFVLYLSSCIRPDDGYKPEPKPVACKKMLMLLCATDIEQI